MIKLVDVSALYNSLGRLENRVNAAFGTIETLEALTLRMDSIEAEMGEPFSESRLDGVINDISTLETEKADYSATQNIDLNDNNLVGVQEILGEDSPTYGKIIFNGENGNVRIYSGEVTGSPKKWWHLSVDGAHPLLGCMYDNFGKVGSAAVALNTVAAYTFTDKTVFPSKDILQEVLLIGGKEDDQLDHESLPTALVCEKDGVKGRNLGATVSYLIKALQECYTTLDARIKALEPTI